MQTLIIILLRLFSLLPLKFLHTLGSFQGGIACRIMSESRCRVIDNLTAVQLPADDRTVKVVFQETAKGGLELPVVFFRRPGRIETLLKAVYGWEHVQTALDAGEGLLFIMPYIGSYDLAGRYISQQLPSPLTAIYKLPEFKAMDAVMQVGRVCSKGKIAPTNIQGVKQVIKALCAGEATIVPPDHVPPPEEGGDDVWTELFGRPACTMTLVGKLAQVRGVKALLFCGERLLDGQGFALHIEPLRGEPNGDKEHDAWIINENTGYWIRRFLAQYLFMYNRYKHPAGMPLPPQR